MTDFQSYVIVGSTPTAARAVTAKLAQSLPFDLNQSSPDLTIISPKKSPGVGRDTISIDQIRALKQKIYQKPLKEKYHFVITERAHKLTIEAQNALLKLLEEPPSHAIIVLETTNQRQLLPTVLSRVVIILDKQQTANQDQLLIGDVLHNLQRIPQIENPQEFLDNQILLLTDLLVGQAKGKTTQYPQKQLIDTIEKCQEAKQMIEANINPRFVLASLIFQLKPASK